MKSNAKIKTALCMTGMLCLILSPIKIKALEKTEKAGDVLNFKQLGEWKQENGVWYYQEPQAKTNYIGWQKIGDLWYYFSLSDGSMKTDWQNMDGNWYYFNPKEGGMETEWRQIDGNWYYFNPKEGYRETGWQKIDNSWYYLREDGIMETGWFSDGDAIYYLHDTQGYMQKGWIEFEDCFYYFGEDGGLMRNAVTPDGKIVDKNGILIDAQEWEIMLVNKEHPVPEDYEVNLTKVQDGERADKRIYEAWKKMEEAAKKEGLSLLICSGYRSYSWQLNRYNQRVSERQRQGYSYEEACAITEKTLAYPGSSEHQTGLALDIITPSYQKLVEGYANTKEGKWLAEHAHEYGFILRYPKDKVDITKKSFEPWHYRYVGISAATEIWEKGICLEEYWAEHFFVELP